MKISKRNFLLLLLSLPSYRTFSCTGGPYEVIELYSERELNGIPRFEASAEKFLNQTYGKNWRYDEKLFLRLPDIAENSAVIPFETGINGNEVAVGDTELTIYAEESVHILNLEGRRDPTREIELNVVEIAKFKFYESAYPYVSTRLRLQGMNKISVFCVYANNNKDLVRVVRQPKPMYTETCKNTVYAKD